MGPTPVDRRFGSPLPHLGSACNSTAAKEFGWPIEGPGLATPSGFRIRLPLRLASGFRRSRSGCKRLRAKHRRGSLLGLWVLPAMLFGIDPGDVAANAID